MATNLELKAIVPDMTAVEAALSGAGLEMRDIRQRDEYLRSTHEYVKLRFNDGAPDSLIRYARAISPKSRPSHYTKLDLASLPGLVAALEPLDRAGVVEKRRRQFRSDKFLINLDELEGVGAFVEIEVFADGDEAAAQNLLSTWMTRLQIRFDHIVPYSNIHLVNMWKTAAAYRKRLTNFDLRGRMVFVDGPSASGKSTLQGALLRHGGFIYIKRETTRKPRPDDSVTHDYEFVNSDEFFQRALTGEYVECRDYEFAMSYGLPWTLILDALNHEKAALGLINLGNGLLLKRLIPESATVLLVADPMIIEKRLRDRGALSEAQIHERVTNARAAASYAQAYDLVIDTGRTPTDGAVREITAMRAP